jgi:uncharacterized OsmC-like protein
MSNRHFHLRLACSYLDEKNNIDHLTLEVLKEGSWQNVALNIKSPGFFLLINGLFSCQHLYMRTNSAERNLEILTTTAELEVQTSQTWEIQQYDVSFQVKLKSGTPSADDITYIKERMKHCPVSKNLSKDVIANNSVVFN